MSQAALAVDEAVEKQLKAELAGLLSPEETFECQLRNSKEANGLRQELRGVKLPETAFRELFIRLQPLYAELDTLSYRSGPKANLNPMNDPANIRNVELTVQMRRIKREVIAAWGAK